MMASLPQRYRAGNRRRWAGLALALLVEALLVLVVLTLGTSIIPREEDKPAVTSVAFRESPERQQSPTKEESKAPVVEQADRPASKAATESVSQPVAQPAPQPPPALIPISPRDMPAATISHLPPRQGPPAPAKRGPMGPPDTGGAAAYADTARVGTAPNGAPLYAAAWYREPYPDELAGYLSTADGPGWGLIACRTAPNWKVEACVELDEYPSGSRIAHAAAAAAWQFQVRPPRVGGVSKVGEWVRIRIDYGIRQRQAR